MTENPKLDVVRKLLAKAERAGTPEEAEAFAAKAEELMARYSIDAALAAQQPDGKPDPIGSRKITLDGYPIPKATLLTAIARNVNCDVVLTHTPNRGIKIATIYGFESDLEAFDILATSLLLQATTAATATHKRVPSINGRTFRHNFLLGFAARINERMSAARVSAAAEKGATSTALAVRDRTVAVRNHIAAEHGKLGKTGTRATHTRSYLAGDAAGQQADLGTRDRVGATHRGVLS